MWYNLFKNGNMIIWAKFILLKGDFVNKERQFLIMMLNDKENNYRKDSLIPCFSFYQFEKELKLGRELYENLVRRLDKEGFIEIEMRNNNFENALISIKSKAILLLLDDEF